MLAIGIMDETRTGTGRCPVGDHRPNSIGQKATGEAPEVVADSKEGIYRDSSVKLYFNVCGKSLETSTEKEFQGHSEIGNTCETDWR